MPGKTKEGSDKVPVLKGLEAEEAVLKYLKKMNRPFGAVDVCANLKGAVPKTATQKILVGLAEKGDITQKPYGKTTFFVAKQSDLEDVPTGKLAAIEAELKSIEEENKSLTEDVKKTNSELTKLRSTPTDEELDLQLKEAKAAVKKTLDYLTPLRAGTSSLLTTEEIAELEADWTKWRAEWVKRRKVFYNLWHLVSDSLPPQQANELAEDLGIEFDTPEHAEIERGPLCAIATSSRRR
ncbi:TBPIP-domain-containing protein [Fomitiporia mediterranea MF3/22]|uniref:TBPIP-domain-containing protein n=1 Tax=Fomitiporia mediterranea (strain MF3/22) TaxID=694068 RepID=UPI0004408796|nr:TBPIP-domain-containing protein [Fomitiporia mediterranea MF3/22]EJD06101.1 TBPIP-domain-containing protein [Fomitiporia mediterranea MF3/22]